MAHDRRHGRGLAGGLLIAGLGALLQSCGKPPPPPASTARVFATDLMGGAKRCEVPSVTLAAGKDVAVAMKVGNDGGWCAITVADGGKSYAAGLLDREPAHGAVLIHTVGDTTRIDYTPEKPFAGADQFVVRLLPGNATIHASVTVGPP